MRALTKITTGVVTVAFAVAGLVTTSGIANADTPDPSPITNPGPLLPDLPLLDTVSLTGTVVKVEDKYATIVLDGGHRKVVVNWDEFTKVFGDLKVGEKIKVVISKLEALLDLVKAQIITVHP